MTPGDETDVDGKAVITIPIDSYIIEMSFPSDLGIDDININGFNIYSDTSYTFFADGASASLPENFMLGSNYPKY